MDAETEEHRDDGDPTSPPAYSRKPLSCAACRIKKIRCDRRSPCCHCTKSNIKCTFPTQRKPRERKPHLKNRVQDADGAPDAEALSSRLQSLESQVCSLRSQLSDVKAATTAAPQHELVPQTAIASSKNNTGSPVSLVKCSFWLTINYELEQRLFSQRLTGVAVPFQHDTITAQGADHNEGDISRLMLQSFQGSQRSFNHPSKNHIILFWDSFKDNVEPMVKMMHISTTNNLFGKVLWDRSSLSASENALLFSIYYITTVSMADETIFNAFGTSKSVFLRHMRALVEQALISAKFSTTPDITVLKALMFFVLVLRKTGEARSAGGLVGVVVHLSQCLRLHKDSSGIVGITPFEREMRRRLFWSVVVLDYRSSEDLGTDPLICSETRDTPLPLNINDEDICEESAVLPDSRDGTTDMTIYLIRLHTLQTSVRVRRLAAEESPQTIEAMDQLCDSIWQETQDMMRSKYLNATSTHELFWAAKIMASMLVSKMRLTDQCSFFLPASSALIPEDVHNRSTAHLAAAIRVMEENHSANIDGRWAKWKWVFVAYSRWQGSAIVFKELLRTQWTPLSEQAWVTLHKIMGDSKLGELECVRDQPVMPVPFGFIYELTKTYRESEFARLRNAPHEAHRLQEESFPPLDAGHGGGSSSDRPGVSASSLERWRRSAGLDNSDSLPTSGVVGMFPQETENSETPLRLCNDSDQDLARTFFPEQPVHKAGNAQPWQIDDMMTCEFMDNLLDELF